MLRNHKELSLKVSKNLNCIFSLSEVPLHPFVKLSHIKIFGLLHITNNIKVFSPSRIWDISHESKRPNSLTKFSIFLVLNSLKWQMMTECLTLFVQGTLEVCFMTSINPCKVHVLSQPWSKLNHYCSRIIHFQNHQKAGNSSSKTK